MFCSKCGIQINPGAAFCGSCGTTSPAATQNPTHNSAQNPDHTQALYSERSAAQNPDHTQALYSERNPAHNPAQPPPPPHGQWGGQPGAGGYYPDQNTELVQTGYVGADPMSTRARMQNVPAPHAQPAGKKSSNAAFICIIAAVIIVAAAAFAELQLGIFGIFSSEDNGYAALENYSDRDGGRRGDNRAGDRDDSEDGLTDAESDYGNGINGYEYLGEYASRPNGDNGATDLTPLPADTQENAQQADDGPAPDVPPDVPEEPQAPPQIAPEDRPPFYDSLGVSVTTFADASVNRAHNIARAAELMHGTVLQPGDTFSFNGAVGQRTAARGFRNAEGFIGDAAVNVLGGGVSHVSSTIYHAAILAGLEILERHTHEFVPGFIGMGLDATVVWGSQDMRIRNNTNFPLRINAVTVGRELTVSIDGINVLGSIAIRTVVTPTNRGYSVDVFRQRLDIVGNVVYEIFLYSDTYTRR